MEKLISAWQARRQFGKLLREVSGGGNSYVVESHGEPIAAVVPIGLYDRWKRRREAFFEQMRAVSERAGLSEEEATRLTEEAVQAVRAQK